MNDLLSLISRLCRYHSRPILITLVLFTALIWGLALAQPHRLTPNVYTLDLPGGCSLDYHTSIHAVALACPGVDYIRLWPVTQPWQDRTDMPDGWYVRRLEPVR